MVVRPHPTKLPQSWDAGSDQSSVSANHVRGDETMFGRPSWFSCFKLLLHIHENGITCS